MTKKSGEEFRQCSSATAHARSQVNCFFNVKLTMPFMAREIPSLFIIRYYFLQGKKSFLLCLKGEVQHVKRACLVQSYLDLAHFFLSEYQSAIYPGSVLNPGESIS